MRNFRIERARYFKQEADKAEALLRGLDEEIWPWDAQLARERLAYCNHEIKRNLAKCT